MATIKYACVNAHIITTENLIKLLDLCELQQHSADFKGHFAGFKERFEVGTLGNAETLGAYFTAFQEFLERTESLNPDVPEGFNELHRDFDFRHFWSNASARFNLFSSDYDCGVQKKQKFVQTGFNLS
tara:strand:+ start:347 stop:730 length:384 start_codon:yes stop_codon:yes gene_type:complete